uniref:non-specific protein-tyrosine kinase n=2 Tax=Anopheles atroparvus TaxID=41427 RepID=A0A182J4H5_ANOAO
MSPTVGGTVEEDVARKKSEYQKHLDYYKLLRSRFEEHIKSGRSGRKLDDVIDKYQKACRKLHQAHNEYVLLITEAVEVEKDFRTILLPGLLEHQQSLQEGFIQAWSNLLQEIAKLSDTTSEKFVDIQRRIESSIAGINSTEEYREFTEKHKTSPTAPVVFQFDEALVEDSLGKLQANTLTVDNLTVDWLRGRQTELEGTIKDLQDRQNKLHSETNGTNGATAASPGTSPVGTPGTKPSTPILNGGSTNGLVMLGKDQTVQKSSKELNSLRCQERQTLRLVDMIRTALNEVGCEELPSGCDDLSVEHLIDNKKSVSQDLSHNTSTALGLFSLRTGGNNGGGGVMSMLIDQLRRKSGPPVGSGSGGSSSRTPRSGPTPVQTPKPGHRTTTTTTVNNDSESCAFVACDRVLQASAGSDGQPATNSHCRWPNVPPPNVEQDGDGATYAELADGNDSDHRLSNVYVDMESYLLHELDRNHGQSFEYTNLSSAVGSNTRKMAQGDVVTTGYSSPGESDPNLTNPDHRGGTTQYRRLRAQASSEDSEMHLLNQPHHRRTPTGGQVNDDEGDDDGGSCTTADELNDSKNNLLREESFDEERRQGLVGEPTERSATWDDHDEGKYLTMKKAPTPPETSPEVTRRWKSSIEQHLDNIDALNQKLDEHQRLAARLSEEYEYIRVQTLRRDVPAPVLAPPKQPVAFEKVNSFREKIKRKIKGSRADSDKTTERAVTPDTPVESGSFSGRLRNRMAQHGQRQFRLMKDTDSASPSTDRSVPDRLPNSNGAGRKKKKRKSAKANRALQRQQGRHGAEQLQHQMPLHPQQAFSEDELLAEEEQPGPSPDHAPKGGGLGTSFSHTVRATWRELLHSTNKVKDSSINLAHRQDRPEEKLDLITDQERPGLLSIRFTFSDGGGEQGAHPGSTDTDPNATGDYCVPLLLKSAVVTEEIVPLNSAKAQEDLPEPIAGNSSKPSTSLKANLRDRFTKLVHKKSAQGPPVEKVPKANGRQPHPEICRTCSKRIVRRMGGIHASRTVLDFSKEFPDIAICEGDHDHAGGDRWPREECDWPLSEMVNLEYEDIDVLTIKPHKLTDPSEGGDGLRLKTQECVGVKILAVASSFSTTGPEEEQGMSIAGFSTTASTSSSYETDSVYGNFLFPPRPPVRKKRIMTFLMMTLSTNRPLHEEEWFHGVLPREEVVRLLRNEGDFLVRETTRNDESQTVLSVCWNGHKHFIVQTTAEGHYRFEGPAFPSIQELIVHQYQSEMPVTGRSGAILRKPVLRERWELSNDDVILLDKIGRGNFGDVYKAKLKSSKNTLVAVKTCRMTLPEEQKRKFLQEGRILKQYDHPNIVKLIGICVQKQPIMIVMELVAGGSLLMFLRKNAQTLGQRQLMSMCRDAAAGMRYLESKNCIHRDLAARNCLIGSENIVKISDFGMSREEEEYIVSGGMKQIPIKWTAPEALNFGKYTSLCDVWSYGILVWEIFSRGDTPYSGMSNSTARERIDEGYRMPSPEGAPPEMYRLMLKCWSYEAESRPHFDEICSVVDALLLCTKD